MLAAAALALALAVPVVLPHRGTAFRGPTAQGHLVSFAVAPGVLRVERLAVIVDVPCGTLGVISERRVFPAVPIHPNGTFAAVSRDVPPRIVPQGDRALIQGRFATPRKAVGTVVLAVRLFDAKLGAVFCQSPFVSWSATVP